MKRRTTQNSIFIYLILNIIVSAATTLAVISIWDRVRTSRQPQPVVQVQATAPEGQPTQPSAATPPVASVNTEAAPTAAQASTGPLIQVDGVVGAGDPQQEYVMLKRLGEGDLSLAGWKLQSENGTAYTFPSGPELILFKGGAVQVYTRAGTDTPTEMYWNRKDAVWHSGQWVTLVDAQGKVQATYQIP